MQENLQQHSSDPDPDIAVGKRELRRLTAILVVGLGGCFLLLAAALVFGFIYQGRVLEGQISKLENKMNQPSLVSYYESLPTQTIAMSPGEKMLGLANAPITIFGFEDFQCPYCHEFYLKVFPEIKKEYIDTGLVQFIQKDYPFLGEESILAAAAGRCAAEENKFWEYRESLYAAQGAENAGTFVNPKLVSMGQELGLNSQNFSDCVNTGKFVDAVKADKDMAAALSVSATPTFFINGKKIEGAIQFVEMKQLLDYILESSEVN